MVWMVRRQVISHYPKVARVQTFGSAGFKGDVLLAIAHHTFMKMDLLGNNGIFIQSRQEVNHVWFMIMASCSMHAYMHVCAQMS